MSDIEWTPLIVGFIIGAVLVTMRVKNGGQTASTPSAMR